MKLLVDEMPYCKEDCLFAEQKWSYEEEIWVNYCKLTSARCDLDKEQCSCLKVPKTEPNSSEKPNNCEPQPNADQRTQDVESVESTQTEREGE